MTSLLMRWLPQPLRPDDQRSLQELQVDLIHRNTTRTLYPLSISERTHRENAWNFALVSIPLGQTKS